MGIDFNDTSSLYLNILQNKANDSAKPMSDEQIKNMSKRLNKGNIALIVVLEEKERKNQKDNLDENDDADDLGHDIKKKKKKKNMKEKSSEEDDHKTNKQKKS